MFIITSLVIFSGFGCKQTNPKKYIVNLEIWGLFDDQDAFTEIIDNYKKANPNIGKITYKKLMPDTYKQEITDALAAGNGPDIFLIQNNWLAQFANKIYPAPLQFLTEKKFKDNFVDVVASDFLSAEGAYGVPLSVDSLGLYYNKDLFNAAGITSPPRDWNEFADISKKLTKFDVSNQIVVSGTAMGTAYNINRSTDILNLLMLQSQTEMVDSISGQAVFDKVVQKKSGNSIPGQDALKFYTQFADSSSPQYSWNSRMHYSIDAFSEGTLGMMLNYSWQIDAIAKKAPKLNFAVAPVPQIPGNPPVNYANYWAFVVAKNKTPDTTGIAPAQATLVTNEIRVEEAWNFLLYLTTKPEQAIAVATGVSGTGQTADSNFDPAINYLEKTNKIAARRDLLDQQKIDAKLGPFVKGNLIAKNWYQANSEAIEDLFSEMINQINRGQASVDVALKTAAVNVSQMMGK
ncbi:MAG: Extracellular solute-binding protein family 1 [Candidatus Moranbacteria bacterium GW2011_GWA2_39_41]|nr:MAG: Extracellular solute-binding protein family 1 [Candidatus Moranbacteria bacterium GW2011_GWA2_39_41]